MEKDSARMDQSKANMLVLEEEQPADGVITFESLVV
jgi:hypothetical protein